MLTSTGEIIPDYHTHHELCRHAVGRTVDYARAALDNGTLEFAATDHCPTDVQFGKEHRMSLDQFAVYRADVDEARREFPTLTIRFGIEADYYPGCTVFLDQFVKSQPFDIVLGSVHFRDYWSLNKSKRGLSDGDSPIVVWQEYFHLIGKLAETGLYDVVTHLDLPKRFGNPIRDDMLRSCCLPALDKIAQANMAIEINTSGMTHSVSEMYPSGIILSWACERGVGLTFGSDAHSPDRVSDRFADAIAIAREAGYRSARRYSMRTWTEYPL